MQLGQLESNEISQLLEFKQKQYLKDYLSQYRIRDASISGIGDKLKARLETAGICTATDITRNRVTSVEGIGLNKSGALISWRDSLEKQARTKMPTSLTPIELKNITQKYESQRLSIESQRNNNQQMFSMQEATIRDEYSKKKQALGAEQTATQNKLNQELLVITNKYSQEYADVSQKLSQLELELQTEIRKQDEVISDLQKRVFACHWKLGKIRHELRAYGIISFGKYIRFVCFGR